MYYNYTHCAETVEIGVLQVATASIRCVLIGMKHEYESNLASSVLRVQARGCNHSLQLRVQAARGRPEALSYDKVKAALLVH